MNPLFKVLAAAVLGGLGLAAQGATNTNWFKIVSLTTNNAVLTDAPLAGSLAASANHLFASRVGDSEFRRWDARGLANPATLSPGFIILADLRTEKVYAFANDDGTMTGTGTATALHELDPATGQTNGVVITLSAGVPVEDTCSPEYGIFCGWGRVVVGSSRLRDITLPGGQVTLLPVSISNPFNQFCDPSEPLTGIAEFFGDELYLVACQPFSGGKFERVRLSDSTRTTVATFSDMLRNTKIAFAPSRNRWYFSTEGSWLGSTSEAISYADATWDQSDEFTPPPLLTVTLPSEITLLEDTSTNALGSFTQRENAGLTHIRAIASSNPALLPPNTVSFFGAGFLFGEAGAFQFSVTPQPNRDGSAVLTFLTTNAINERVTNQVTVNVIGVSDAPVGEWTFSHLITNAQAVAVTITNTLRLIDPDTPATNLLVRVFSNNPLLVPAGNLTLLPGETNRPVLVTLTANLTGRVDVFAEIVDPADGSITRSFYFTITVQAADGERTLRPFTTVRQSDMAAFGLGGLRGLGVGVLSVTGLVGSVKQALLYWQEQTKADFAAPSLDVPPVFQGAALGGPAPAVPVEALRVSGSNCWPFQYGITYRADVTSLLLGNGDYLLSNFTTNACQFVSGSQRCATRDASGVSLLVFYDDGNPANDRDVMIFEGNDANEPNLYDAPGWSVRMPQIGFAGGTAQLGLHVSDGQDGTNYLDGELRLNGITVFPAGTNFEGNTTPRSTGGAGNGSLWDIRNEDITSFLTPGTNTLHLTSPFANDCLSLVAITLSLPAGAALPVADLSIRQHVTTATATNPPTAVVSNDPVVIFTFTVTNAGSFAAEGVRVTNLFGAGVSVDAASVSQGSLAIRSDDAVAALGTLNPGTIATITLSVRYPRVGYFVNHASVSADTHDPRADADPATGQFVSQEIQVLSIGTTPRPKLTIQSAVAGQYAISWSPATPGFTLQSSDSLSPPIWTNAPSGTNNPVTIPATLPAKFYRLFKP